MDFLLSKLEQTLASLRGSSIDQTRSLDERYSAPAPAGRHLPASFPAVCAGLPWREFSRRDRWGEIDEARVFYLPVTIPPQMDGKDVYLRLTTGREGGYTAFNPQFLLYVDGELRQGMDINHTEVLIAAKAGAGSRIEIHLHAHAGYEPGLMELSTELVTFHGQVKKLYYAFLTALKTMVLLPEDSGDRAVLARELLRVSDLLVFHMAPGPAFLDSVDAAFRHLNNHVYEKDWPASPVRAICVGHTHIDIAWRWTIGQTRQKVQRSFMTALALMDKYPEYRFFSSQPILYSFVKQDNPGLFARIKEMVRQGRWEAEGGMWLEADCNLPSGESLIRQIYYGKKFLREEFSVDSKILWLPDSFGYSAVLPQLMRQSGLEYFITSKLSWNEFNRVPHDLFQWQGLDGSLVTASLITTPDDTGLPNSPDFSTYNATLQPKNVLGAWQRLADKDLSQEVMLTYGYGDGGGGPTEEMIESGRLMARGLPGLPQVELGLASGYFARLGERLNNARTPPRHVGELYLEFHRGTYTSVAAIKKQNLTAEARMRQLELVLALAGKSCTKEREDIWKQIMGLQFHDVLPGSGIKEVYADTDRDYADIMEQSGKLLAAGLNCLAGQKLAAQKTLCVLSSHWQEKERLLILGDLAGYQILDQGRPLETQALSDGSTAVFFPRLPANGLKTYALAPQEETAAATPESGSEDGSAGETGLLARNNRLENSFFRLVFNSKGHLSSIYDKRNRREVLRQGTCGNRILAYEDRPATCDAWNIDVTYRDKEYPIDQVRDMYISEEGPLCLAMTIEREFMHSAMHQIVRIYRDIPRIDFATEIDWQEDQVLLKTQFPVDVNTTEAACGLQFGHIRRPVHSNTEYEKARFETFAHNFADLSETGYGVSLFTGDKYGVDFADGSLRLTLLKSPIDPWPGADKGVHKFTYSLYPHAGDILAAGVYAESAVAGRYETLISGELAPDLEMAAASCAADNISIEAVKPAEDNQGQIIRLSEFANMRCETELELPKAVKAAWQCDLLEQNQQQLAVEGSKVKLSFRPFEIKTIRIRY